MPSGIKLRWGYASLLCKLSYLRDCLRADLAAIRPAHFSAGAVAAIYSTRPGSLRKFNKQSLFWSTQQWKRRAILPFPCKQVENGRLYLLRIAAINHILNRIGEGQFHHLRRLLFLYRRKDILEISRARFPIGEDFRQRRANLIERLFPQRGEVFKDFLLLIRRLLRVINPVNVFLIPGLSFHYIFCNVFAVLLFKLIAAKGQGNLFIRIFELGLPSRNIVVNLRRELRLLIRV